jgi:hypothetical protein
MFLDLLDGVLFGGVDYYMFNDARGLLCGFVKYGAWSFTPHEGVMYWEITTSQLKTM